QADANATLIFTFVGMKTREIALNGLTNVNVEMEMDAEQMEDVVVTGMYGSAKRLGSITGSVTTVGEAKLKDRPVANIADALQGQMAGLQTFTSSGEPSATVSIRLRGINSINAGNTPLIIVDGAPVTASALRSLNANDIENVVLLKDASATAIYGSRAANGVMIVTTKKGRTNEEPRVMLKAQYGISAMAADNLPMMNAREYLDFRELVNPALLENPTFQAHKEWALKYNVDTDWKEYLFKDNSPFYELNMNVTGATDRTNYYLSAGYYSQEGITHHSDMKRMNLRSNIDTQVKEYLRMGLNFGLSHEKYRETFSTSNGWYNPTNFAKWADPSYSPYTYTYDENDNIIWGDRWEQNSAMGGLYNPQYVMENQPSWRQTTRLIGSSYIEVTPLKGLTIKGVQAVDAFDYRNSGVSYPELFGIGTVTESFQRFYSFTFTNTVEYKFDLNSMHHFTLLAGQESIAEKNNQFGARTEGHSDRRLMLLNTRQTSAQDGFSATRTETVFNSWFGRVEYDYNSRYFFDASIRTDGSSRFGKDHRWGTFYSLGAMWNAKSESFLEDVSWVNDLRLKASYGETGNSSISDYAWIGSIGSGMYNGSSAWTIGNLSNDKLTWETVGSLNIGIHARFLDRYGLELDYYSKKTTNMLMTVPLSYTTGHASYTSNVGEMTNKGIDLTVRADILKEGDFFWSVSGTLNYNKNRIEKLYEGIDEFENAGTGMKYQPGHALGEFYYARYAGVNPVNGEQLWYTPEGELTNQFSADNSVFLGKNRYAPYTGGFSTLLSWKGITLSADFSFVLDKYLLNNDRYFVENSTNTEANNMARSMFRMWQKPGDITDIPRAGEKPEFDSRLLENASFGRLKNLTISYDLPKTLLAKTGFLQGTRVYAGGRNLLTWTEYSGYDPEVDSNLQLGNYPNTKQYFFGVELTF
ncbi:MAG: SusC/RagA family TonB-linked outer membrane protein, partial [Culturomica sp.]|nr:SusC/RagA family TonB-linked outer membrane protein [Culturomica sp.]